MAELIHTYELRKHIQKRHLALESDYTLEEIQTDSAMREVLDWIDVLVDKPFEEDKTRERLSYSIQRKL